MAKRSSRERARFATLAKLGGFIVVTGLLTALIALQIARVGLDDGYRLTATFDDASGLTPGDQVKIAGAPVGRVDEVAVVRGRAKVDFTVRHGVRIPSDSEAAIRWRDTIGRRVIYLIPGTSRTEMRAGTHITKTKSVVDVGELVNQLAPLTRTLNADQVNRLLGTLAQALDGNAQNVDRLIGNVDSLSSTIAARRQNLDRMLDDYATITGVIARRDRQIGAAVDDLVTLSDAFVDNRVLIDRAIVQLAQMSTTADQVIGRNGEQLGTVIDRLTVLTGGARRNTESIQQVLALTAPKMERLFNATNEGQFINLAVPCLTVTAPPCPYDTKLPGAMKGTSDTGPQKTEVPGGGRIDSRTELRRLLVGGN